LGAEKTRSGRYARLPEGRATYREAAVPGIQCIVPMLLRDAVLVRFVGDNDISFDDQGTNLPNFFQIQPDSILVTV